MGQSTSTFNTPSTPKCGATYAGHELAPLKVSVVIPALNESSSIATALQSLRSAVLPPVEVVVVDGGSTDGTPELARKLGAKVVPSARGRGRQLNTGWRASSGDWCLFLHADSVLPPAYDQKIAEALASRQRQLQQWARRWPVGKGPLRCGGTGAAGGQGSQAPGELSGGMRSRAPGRGLCGSADGSSSTDHGTGEGACRGATEVPRGEVTRSVGGGSGGGRADQGACGACSACNSGCGGCGGGGCEGRRGAVGCCGNSSVGVRWAARSAAAAAAQVGCIDGGVSGGNRCTAGAGGKHQELESQCQVASTSGGAAVAPTWGAFATIHTDLRSPFLRRLLSLGVELRTRVTMRPYGDQALFVRRDVLEACGGFKEWPLLEDLELVQRLAREQPCAIVDGAVRTSGRRWQTVGFWETTLINQVILLGYALGVSPERLAQLYGLAKKRAAEARGDTT